MSLTIRLLRDTTGDLSWERETISQLAKRFLKLTGSQEPIGDREEKPIWGEPLRGQGKKVLNPSHTPLALCLLLETLMTYSTLGDPIP